MAIMRALQPAEAPQAKQLIYEIAYQLFPETATLEETIAAQEAARALHDLDDISAYYLEAHGAFLLMQDDSTQEWIGMGAIRRLDQGICELKRFWFRPAYHGTGMAAQLLQKLLLLARAKGYRKVWLKTHPVYQARAVAFYQKHGFHSIPFYGTDDLDDVAMEFDLPPAIRIAAQPDLPRLVEIYNQAIATRRCTADTEPFNIPDRQAWFDAHTPNEHPIYVSLDGTGQITGYLSISSYRNRLALQRTGEVSYYVANQCQGQGIGSALMAHALQQAPLLGKKVLVAILLDWNTPSIRLLTRFGFERWGLLPDAAEIDGQVCGHAYYGRKV